MTDKKSDLEDKIQELLAELLKNLGVTFKRFKMEKRDRENAYRIDIDTDEASLLIGYHGEAIHALQQILKTIVWRQCNESVFVVLDVDSYRKRQEESVLKLSERKVEEARKTLEDQTLPPMSPYFRRLIHLHLTKNEFDDITTESIGDGDRRAIVIKVQKVQ